MILRIQTDSADWKLEVQVLNSWRWKNFCNICNMLLHNEPELLHFENLKKQLWPHQNIDLESKWGYPRGWFYTEKLLYSYCTPIYEWWWEAIKIDSEVALNVVLVEITVEHIDLVIIKTWPRSRSADSVFYSI